MAKIVTKVVITAEEKATLLRAKDIIKEVCWEQKDCTYCPFDETFCPIVIKGREFCFDDLIGKSFDLLSTE